MTFSFKNCFKKYAALPQDHGAWALFFSPMLIGLFAAQSWRRASLSLLIGALAAFLLRQPLSIAVKVYSHRRPRSELPAALCWLGIYSLVGLLTLIDLYRLGDGQIIWLAIPALLVLAWHLRLISRRAERRQIGAEIVGVGTLSLAAAAAYWVGRGAYDAVGWLIWLLTWLQAAASIVYAYLRLAQRGLKEMPSRQMQWQMGRRALLYTSFNLIFSAALSLTGYAPRYLFLAFLIQWGETIWGITHPAVHRKPVYIGVRQMIVTILFTVTFIIFWSTP